MYKNIAIIGCGPAGASAAIRLLEKDPSKDVTIYETRREIGFPARCAGGLHGSRAKSLGIEVPEDIIVSKIQKLRFHSPRQWAEFDLRKFGFKGDYWTINRTKFDQYLAKKAESLGAKIITRAEVVPAGEYPTIGDPSGRGASPRGLVINRQESDGTTTAELLDYDVLIGAAGFQEGTFSGSDLFSTQKVAPKDIAICLQYVIEVVGRPQDTMDFFFGTAYAPGGYVWIFPGGNYDVRIGLGVPADKHCNTAKLLDKMVAMVGWTKGEYFKGCIGRTLPTTKLPKTGLLRNNILLVGDQLHVTDPLTGGGIIPAILTGRAAADAILKNDLTLYDQIWKPLLKDNNKRYSAKKLFELNDNKLDRLVKLIGEFHPKNLTPGTEIMRLLKYLVRRDPLLCASLLRALL